MTSTRPAHPIADIEPGFEVEPDFELPPKISPEREVRRYSYVIGIAINIVLLIVANSLLDWDWPPFLTSDFADVLPFINVSLLATMVATAIYLGYDAQWFKSITQVITGALALLATVRVYDVFPFDYAAYDFPWDTTTRVVLIIVMVATAFGMLVESFRFSRTLPRS